MPWKEQNDSWCLLFLRSSIEHMALVKNYKTDKQRLIDSLKILMSCREAVERLYQEWLIIKNPASFCILSVRIEQIVRTKDHYL